MKICIAAGICLGLGLLTAPAAKASTLTYAFSFTGTFSGSGDIVVNSAVDSLGGHDILGITGTISGPSSGTITQLDTQPGTPPATGVYTDPVTKLQWIYNDVLFTSGTPFDYDGVLFNFGSSIVGNIYSIGSQLYLSVSKPSTYFDPGAQITMKLSLTPLPPALLMFFTGLCGIGFLMYRLHRSTVDGRSQQAAAT